MITKDKVIEIFCIIDEFDKNLSVELSKKLRRKNAAPSYNRHCKRCAYAADGTRAPDPFHACGASVWMRAVRVAFVQSETIARQRGWTTAQQKSYERRRDFAK